MSTTMISIGCMAVLATPLDYDTAANDLYEKGLYINYDGTLVYSKTTNVESCEFDELHIVRPEEGKHKLLVAAAKAGLSIEADTVKPFFCHWYNGSDSPMSTITKEEFLEE